MTCKLRLLDTVGAISRIPALSVFGDVFVEATALNCRILGSPLIDLSSMPNGDNQHDDILILDLA